MKSCTDWCETDEDKDRRIDMMLREMVIEKGIKSLADGIEPEPLTLQEISEFVGIGFTSLQRIEQQALDKLRNKMLN